MLFDSRRGVRRVRTFAAEANEQNFDRLAGELAEMAPGGEPFTITRDFDAPASWCSGRGPRPNT